VIVELPASDVRAKLLADNAKRFPEAFDFKLPIDGDKEDTLKVVLGTPAGGPGWDNVVAVTLKPKSATADNPAFVMDCLVWPDLPTWGGLCRRWPALPGTVAQALRLKLGGSLAMIGQPAGDPPAAIQAALAANKSAVWRRLTPGASPVDIAIQPPEDVVWRFFQDELSKDGTEHWKLARDFATASVAASTLPIADVFDRWPGCALIVTVVSSKLAGIAAEYEKGEF
jgi:hypothetical protein